jgi:putative transposase
VIAFAQIVLRLLADAVGLAVLSVRPRRSLEAENLVLRRQLALFKERGMKPRRIDAATRASLALLSRWCDWRSCLIVVRPETVIRWHRAGWRLFWRYRSRPGRPSIPLELRQLIRRMATDNPQWGEERIANELLVKLGIRVSPRTVRKYMPKRPPGQPRGDQRWSTFLKNHAKCILACDFFVAVTATFRMLYVFVVIEHATRRLRLVNVTEHPDADWTLQQLREVVGDQPGHRYLIHDRDRIYAKHLDESIRSLGLNVLRSPVSSPKANAICERVIGTIRRECLDCLIPMSETHLRAILKEWVTHYNQGRVHSMLGPGAPDPPQVSAVFPKPESRHRLATGVFVRAKSVLGGLHREYSLATSCPSRKVVAVDIVDFVRP